MLYPVEDFICCLAPTENAVLYGVLAHWYTLEFYITHDDYDLLWFVVTGDVTSPRKDTFLHNYHLHDDVIVLPDETEVPIWRMNTAFWVLIANYNDFHGWPCEEPCWLGRFLP